MDSDILIKTIVERVISKLQEESCCNNSVKIMVLSAYSQELETYVLKCLNTTDVALCFWGDGHAHKEVARCIIPQLSCGDMADLAAGQAKGPITEAVLQRLLAGKTVEVLDYEYKAYEKTASPALYKLYLQYESTLSSFGLTSFKPEPEPVTRCWQGLVTERDVAQAAQYGAKEMHVTKNCLVTPLAMDQAKLSHISIHKEL